MLQRLDTRLTVAYIALMTGVFLLLGLYLSDYVRDLQTKELETQLQAEAWLVAEAARPLIGSEAGGDIEDYARRAAQETNARITIIRWDGTVVADSEADASRLENHVARPEFAAALAGEVGKSRRLSATLDEELIYIAVPVIQDRQIIGAARVAIPSDRFAGLVRGVIQGVVGALALAAIAIAALSAVVARVLFRPLAGIIAVARRVARGDLSARADESAGGELAAVAEAFNEMTLELRNMIEAIEEDRGRLDAVIEHLTDGIVMIDQHGSTVLMNRAAERLLGISRDRAIGRPYAEVVRDHELAGLIAGARALQVGDGQPPSRIIETGRPRRVIHAFAYTVLHHETPLVLILRDITELRRTDAIRRDFVANVSHELRTPIASLRALVETLLDGALEDEEAAREFLQRMEVEVEGLASLVADLLELSRVESGRVELHPVTSEIAPVVERVVTRLQTQAEQKGIDVRIVVPDDVPAGYYDPDRVEQILVNLVHNAIKFTPPSGRVTVSVRRHEGSLAVEVSDTGPGIPPEDLDRVFERFYKTDRSRSDTGTGLGLAIARHLVELQGGQIWAESVLGQGATFTFTLPLSGPKPVDQPDTVATTDA